MKMVYFIKLKKMLKMYEANILCIKMKNRISKIIYAFSLLSDLWRERDLMKRLLNKFYSCNNYLYQITRRIRCK